MAGGAIMAWNKWHWEPIDPDIIAGMGDVEVAKKHSIPISTVYFHRVRQLGITTNRQKWKWGDKPTSHSPSQNVLMTTPREKILKKSIKIKLRNLSPQHRQVFLQSSGKLSAGYQFREGLR
jgi:hypothetical protein